MEKENIKRYVEQGLNNSEIAELIGCHRTTVSKKMEKYALLVIIVLFLLSGFAN
jgi:IS30 family transposase